MYSIYFNSVAYYNKKLAEIVDSYLKRFNAYQRKVPLIKT